MAVIFIEMKRPSGEQAPEQSWARRALSDTLTVRREQDTRVKMQSWCLDRKVWGSDIRDGLETYI